jgi:hypothetical protein
LIEAKPNAGNFIKLIEAHAEESFGYSLYNFLTEVKSNIAVICCCLFYRMTLQIEMQHLKREALYKSIVACILECAYTIRNENVETQLLAACKSFKEDKTCSLTRRQLACLLANIFLCTFKPANPRHPNVSLAT